MILEGKVALVTGGGRGIGRGCAIELGKLHQRTRRPVLGQCQRLAALEGQVPAPVADPGRRLHPRLERGGGGEQRLVGRLLPVRAGSDHQRQVRDRIGLHRFEQHARRVDQRQIAIVLPHRRGRALDDVDQQSIGQPPRHMRVRDPAIAQQFVAHRLEIDERHRAALLIERDRIDRHPVHPLQPGDLDLVDLEPRAPGAFGHRAADHAGDADPGRRRDHDRAARAEDRPGRDLLQRVLADREHPDQPIEHRHLLDRDLAPRGGPLGWRAALDRPAHGAPPGASG